MKVGDLIRIKAAEHVDDGRNTGTIIRFDTTEISHRDEAIIDVLWCTGKTGWILAERVEPLDVCAVVERIMEEHKGALQRLADTPIKHGNQ